MTYKEQLHMLVERKQQGYTVWPYQYETLYNLAALEGVKVPELSNERVGGAYMSPREQWGADLVDKALAYVNQTEFEGRFNVAYNRVEELKPTVESKEEVKVEAKVETKEETKVETKVETPSVSASTEEEEFEKLLLEEAERERQREQERLDRINPKPVVDEDDLILQTLLKQGNRKVDEYGNPDYIESATMFDIRQGKKWLSDAKDLPETKELIKDLWVEGEVACLFADSNVGKSILAVQFAREIAKTQRVVYFDFEMSTKQFMNRYCDDRGVEADLPSNFYRAEIDASALSACAPKDLEESVVKHLEKAMDDCEATVLIIDNLTYLCLESESGDAAGRLMMSLMKLKQLNNWSVMVLAHTPKRDPGNPLSANDLAGSKRLFNFFDTVIGMAKCVGSDTKRYLKQLKVRTGGFTYPEGNVLTMELVKKGADLYFEYGDTASEHKLIREPSKDDERLATVADLLSQGKSTQEIIEEMGLGRSTGYELVKKVKSLIAAENGTVA